MCHSRVIYCIVFNFRKALLFAEAPAAPSVPPAFADFFFFFFFVPRAALPGGCRCAAAAAGGSVACAVETGGLPAAARRWKGVKAPKGNSCAAAILLPPRFLARRSRRHHRAFSISPSSSLAETSTSHGRRRAPRGRRVVVGGEGRLSRPGQCCLSPPFSPGGTEKRRFPPAPPSRPPSPPPRPWASGFSRFHARSVLTKLCCCWRRWLPKVC